MYDLSIDMAVKVLPKLIEVVTFNILVMTEVFLRYRLAEEKNKLFNKRAVISVFFTIFELVTKKIQLFM